VKLVALGTLSLALGLAGCSVQDASTEPVTAKADIPTAGLQHLEFHGTSGETKIGVSLDDAVHVKLVLQQEERRVMGARLASETTLHDVEGAKVGQDRKGDVLTLSAAYPSGESHDTDVKVQWTIQVPARFSVDASMKAGRMVIEGVAGGVKAQLSAGEVTIHVPGGPVWGRMSAGRLHVVSDAAQAGHVVVKSTFGLAVLSLSGQYYGPPPQKEGFWSSFRFFGNSVSEQGTGKDDMDLQITAGLTDLRVGPLGDKEERSELFTDDK